MGKPKPGPSAEDVAGNGGNLTPGVATLLHGKHQEAKPQEQEIGQGGIRLTLGVRRLLQASLGLGDLLLVGLAARLAFKSGGAFGATEVALCVIAMAIGAWLGCLAVWLE